MAGHRIPTRSRGGSRSWPQRRVWPEIDLHDVRHSYATAGRDAKIDWKALSQRIGHSDVAFTMKQYVQADREAERQVAITLAELMIGGSLASMEIGTSQGAA
jgi:integrase